MARRIRSRRMALLLAASSVLGIPACFVSIDESLLDQPQTDAATDSQADTGKVDGQADSSDSASDVTTDSTADGSDSAADGDAKLDSTADTSSDAGDSSNDSAKDSSGDSTTDSSSDSTTDSSDSSSDVSTDTSLEAGDTGVDSSDAGVDSSKDSAVDSSLPPLDGSVSECVDNSGCLPSKCQLRSCVKGVCVISTALKEDAGTLVLPAGLSCTQASQTSCLTVSNGYLFAVTSSGIVAYNVRNPGSIVPEKLTLSSGFPSSLIRSGRRIWGTRTQSSTDLMAYWLDLPGDGSHNLPSLVNRALTVTFPQKAFEAPGDSLFFWTTSPTNGYAKYAPGYPSALAYYPAAQTTGFSAEISSGTRMLMQQVTLDSISKQFKHDFLVQNSIVSAGSANTGTTSIDDIATRSSVRGDFATGPTGAVVWQIATQPIPGEWAQTRLYRLVSDGASNVLAAVAVLENYLTPTSVNPQGPVTFISEQRVAALAAGAAIPDQPALSIVNVPPTGTPIVMKRVVISSFSSTVPLLLSADDSTGTELVFVGQGDRVRIFAPQCSP